MVIKKVDVQKKHVDIRFKQEGLGSRSGQPNKNSFQLALFEVLHRQGHCIIKTTFTSKT